MCRLHTSNERQTFSDGAYLHGVSSRSRRRAAVPSASCLVTSTRALTTLKIQRSPNSQSGRRPSTPTLPPSTWARATCRPRRTFVKTRAIVWLALWARRLSFIWERRVWRLLCGTSWWSRSRAHPSFGVRSATCRKRASIGLRHARPAPIERPGKGAAQRLSMGYRQFSASAPAARGLVSGAGLRYHEARSPLARKRAYAIDMDADGR